MRSGDTDVSRRTFLASGALSLAGATGGWSDASHASERVSFTRHEVVKKDETIPRQWLESGAKLVQI